MKGDVHVGRDGSLVYQFLHKLDAKNNGVELGLEDRGKIANVNLIILEGAPRENKIDCRASIPTFEFATVGEDVDARSVDRLSRLRNKENKTE